MKIVKNTKDRLKRAGNINLLTEQFRFITGLIRKLFIPQRSDRRDTFQDLPNLGITPEQIETAKKSFFRLTGTFLGVAVLCLLYALYSLWGLHYFSGLIALALTLMCLAQAFRYHFWLMQIHKQKLGCTFQEWLDYTFKRKR